MSVGRAKASDVGCDSNCTRKLKICLLVGGHPTIQTMAGSLPWATFFWVAFLVAFFLGDSFAVVHGKSKGPMTGQLNVTVRRGVQQQHGFELYK